MRKPTCNICGSIEIKLVYDKAVDYISGHCFQVWKCARCQTGITSPAPPDMSLYYPRQYRRYAPWIGKILQLFYRLRVKSWSDQFPQPGAAFEMGCGNGLMLDTLRELGWQVLGSERTPEAAYPSRHRLGIPVFVGEVNALCPGPQFDLIFLFQVLEHLDDPLETVQQLSRLLRPHGKLIIGVPNFASWQSRVGREKWFHLDVPRHLRHYSPNSLAVLLERGGMKIESTSYVSFEHDVYGWIQTVLNRLDGSFNRLTRLLMHLSPVDPISLMHLGGGILLGIFMTPLTVISWLFKKGGMIQITARRLEGN